MDPEPLQNMDAELEQQPNVQNENAETGEGYRNQDSDIHEEGNVGDEDDEHGKTGYLSKKDFVEPKYWNGHQSTTLGERVLLLGQNNDLTEHLYCFCLLAYRT